MASNIDVKEAIEDKNSWFNIKRFNISGTDFDFPVKTLDTKEIKQDTFNRLAKNSGFQIFEVSKNVRKFDAIQSIIEESNDDAIKSFFSRKQWLDSSPNVINFTFNFNPLDHIRDVDELSGFFDLYYEYSKLLVSVPNLKLQRYNDGKPENVISVDQYLKFVDSVFDILNTKNNKPIFVPISLRVSVKDIESICSHYLANDHLNFWIDFEGKAINEQQLGRLRHLYRILQEKEQFKNVVCYCTNIKREVISNSKIDASPASDVLAAISGANIIGVNREPQRPSVRQVSNAIVEHKTRILDRKTYYYNKTKDPKYAKKNANVTYNAVKLNEEFQLQSENFLKEMTIVDSIKNKAMLKENEKLLKALTQRPSSNQKIVHWF